MSVDLRRVRTARGAEIAVLAYAPRRDRGVALVVAHGYSSSKHNLDVLCSFLSSHGFAIYSLDFPGHKLGASGGRLERIEDCIEAMQAVVAHARPHHAVVYAAGHSMGAMTALMTTAIDPTIDGAISIATGLGRPSALDALQGKGAVDLRSSYVDGMTLQEVVAQAEPRVAAALPALAGRPVLYVAASRDMMVNRASVQGLYDAASQPKTFALVESDHTFAGENARTAILQWLNVRHPREAALR